IHESVLALTERRARRVETVWANEPRINRLEIAIDELATRLLALQQPIASDLRFITAAIKINTDLERMGDLAVNIAQRALVLIEKPAVNTFADIPKMAELAQEMVRKCLDAFVRRDPDLAREVLLSDDKVDRLRTAVQDEMIEHMQKEPAAVADGVGLILISRHLERIADHATNIAEDTLFLVKGVDVRHRAEARA
ncbi:MAG: phosphate signaling complex protein PhoU, partial [Bryobacteraceae bacterium]